MLRKFSLMLVVVVFCSMFAGCFDSDEVDELGYVAAIGVDKGKTNVTRVTLQIVKAAAIGAGGNSGGGGSEGGEKTLSTITIEAPAVISALDQANNFISKKIDLSHAKSLVFSKEIAEDNIGSYINAFPRVKEIRPNIEIVVSRTSAEDYIKSVKPALEINPAKFYEMTYGSFTYTGFTKSVDLHTFSWMSKSSYQDAVCTLAGVSKFEKADEINNDASTYREKGRQHPLEGDFKAGDLPKIGDVKAELMGLAVFRGGKMVGELDGEETMFHLMVSGDYKHSYITIPDPMQKDTVVILDVYKSRNPAPKVRIENGKPVIDVGIYLEANIYVIQSGINYESPQGMPVLERAYEDYLKNGIEKFLYRTSREFGSDICGFGKAMKSKFLTWGDWEQFNWKDRYRDSQFNVYVDMKIRRTGLMVRTIPIRN